MFDLVKKVKVIQYVALNQLITYYNVELKPSTVWELRKIQDAWYDGKLSEAEMLQFIDKLALD